MSNHDDDRPSDDGVYQSESATPQHLSRRRRIAIGALGLTAVVGAGTYLITTQTGDGGTVRRDVGALAPAISASAPAAPASAGPSAAGSAKPSASAAASPSAGASPSKSMSVEEQIKAAREAAAKDGYPVQHARTPAPGVAAAGRGEVEERNENLENGSLRIVTAKFDLTGQREMLWLADNGKPVGNARCTQNFQFSNNKKAGFRRNLLVCWRTSATRSVVTALVDQNGKPSAATSIAVTIR